MAQEKSREATVAAAIRSDLKASNIKAESVRRGSGYDSVLVVLRGANPEIVREVEKIARRYEMGTFDGTDDSYRLDNINDEIPQVRYVFVDNISYQEI